MSADPPTAHSPADIPLGVAMAASLLIGGLLKTLHLKGWLSREEIVFLADSILLALERMREMVEGAPGAVDCARERLEQLITQFQTQDPN